MSEQNNRIEGKHQLQFHLRIDGISQFSIYSNLEIFYPKPETQPILTTRLQTPLVITTTNLTNLTLEHLHQTHPCVYEICLRNILLINGPFGKIVAYITVFGCNTSDDKVSPKLF